MKAPNELPPVISLDGVSGSGKGTIRSWIASIFEFNELDSGILYRLVGLEAFRLGILPTDHPSLSNLARNLNLRIEGERIFLNDKDETDLTRSEKASSLAKEVARISEVRLAVDDFCLSRRQWPGLVIDGRNGGKLFPDPNFRFYLTAPAKIRAEWRFKQCLERGEAVSFDEVLEKIVRRDMSDFQNPANQLERHPKAEPIQTSDYNDGPEAAMHIADRCLELGLMR